MQVSGSRCLVCLLWHNGELFWHISIIIICYHFHCGMWYSDAELHNCIHVFFHFDVVRVAIKFIWYKFPPLKHSNISITKSKIFILWSKPDTGKTQHRWPTCNVSKTKNNNFTATSANPHNLGANLISLIWTEQIDVTLFPWCTAHYGLFLF